MKDKQPLLIINQQGKVTKPYENLKYVQTIQEKQLE
jgi:hypothetical protein